MTDTKFLPMKIAVMTISDTRDIQTDTSGAILCDRIQSSGHSLIARKIIPDDRHVIVQQLRQWVSDPSINVIISNGGTGLTKRDVTPEAFMEVIEKRIDGFGELFRFLSYKNISTSTVQSRALGGIANKTYMFALPGSNGAVKDAWDQILVHQLDIRHKPCNFAELLPRL